MKKEITITTRTGKEITIQTVCDYTHAVVQVASGFGLNMGGSPEGEEHATYCSSYSLALKEMKKQTSGKIGRFNSSAYIVEIK